MNLTDEEKRAIYEQAEGFAREGTEESLEQAMTLFRSIRGWKDAEKRFVACRTRLGQMRWKVESARLKAEEDRYEEKVKRYKKAAITLLAAVLLCVATVTTVTLYKFWRYNKAAELFTAGEYESAASAFRAMGDYQDAKARVFMSAVELYKKKRYAEAMPYFIWLDGYLDNGYFLKQCQERLAAGQ